MEDGGVSSDDEMRVEDGSKVRYRTLLLRCGYVRHGTLSENKAKRTLTAAVFLLRPFELFLSTIKVSDDYQQSASVPG
ncbi:hypothetical protein OPV22_022278 [Ensete ventricosum]|uniref:Uncharacterized protein n=1 Tax=Ensete ventricosum TaxID=4639 RepID=A0AAV8PBR7_ENSVE|nr:hypothetical protein OPV22_022278 [Ensete ventricosum]